MNLKNLQTYLDNINPPLKEIYKTQIFSMFYDVYLEGIEEGREQVKNKIVNNLLLLMGTDE